MTQGPGELDSFTNTQVNRIFRDSPQNTPTQLSTPYSEGIIPGLPYGQLPTKQLPPLIIHEPIPVVSFASATESRPNYGRRILGVAAGLGCLALTIAGLKYGVDVLLGNTSSANGNGFNPKPITVVSPTRSAVPTPDSTPTPTELPTVTVTATATATETTEPSVIQTTVTATASVTATETVSPPAPASSPSQSSPNASPTLIITTGSADSQGLDSWRSWWPGAANKGHKNDQQDMSGFEQELATRLQANGVNVIVNSDELPTTPGNLLLTLHSGKNGVSYGVHEHMFNNPLDSNVDQDKSDACVANLVAATAVQQWSVSAKGVNGPTQSKLGWTDPHAPSIDLFVKLPNDPGKHPEQTTVLAGQVGDALVGATRGWQAALDSCK